jgi:CheY-like chemotaxis protein
MPFMDGVALVRGLRKIAPEVKVIAASGLMDDPDQSGKLTELRNLGVSRFLTKPYTAEDLLAAIHGQLSAGLEMEG